MKKISIFLISIFVVSFYACKDNRAVEPEVIEIDNSSDEAEIYAVKSGDAKFNDSNIAAIFNQYIHLQNALINTDGEIAQKESDKLLHTIHEVGVEIDENLTETITAMAKTSDIKVQREEFETLNEWMEIQVKNALESGTIYKQYCPMAFNDKGAYWLSTDKEILNPYFGDVMLHCGRVDSEIN